MGLTSRHVDIARSPTLTIDGPGYAFYSESGGQLPNPLAIPSGYGQIMIWVGSPGGDRTLQDENTYHVFISAWDPADKSREFSSVNEFGDPTSPGTTDGGEFPVPAGIQSVACCIQKIETIWYFSIAEGDEGSVKLNGESLTNDSVREINHGHNISLGSVVLTYSLPRGR